MVVEEGVLAKLTGTAGAGDTSLSTRRGSRYSSNIGWNKISSSLLGVETSRAAREKLGIRSGIRLDKVMELKQSQGLRMSHLEFHGRVLSYLSLVVKRKSDGDVS
ncbi:hypothetical protein Tco_1204989 [Tanacetum coccineum]